MRYSIYMFKRIIFLFILIFWGSISAQNKGLQRKTQSNTPLQEASADKTRAVASATDTVATIDIYRIITLDRDTTYVDTSLTIQKEYAVNYLRKDNFGLLPFANEGQTYNTLDYGLVDFNPFPQFGFRAKHFAYMEVEDIKYYSVATPFTDLFYRSVIQQGQIMDAFITLNTSENLNFAIGYKGLRSLGRYINQLSSNGNFRFITSYNTSDKRYILNLHITTQDFTNQENGGITDLPFFESGEDPYTSRERLNVYFRDATSILKGNRYFFDHTFRLSKNNPNSIVLHHQFNYENKFFEFTQPTVSTRFGPSYTTTINNKTRFNRMYNKLGAAYTHKNLGQFEFYVEDFNYNYYYNRVIISADEEDNIPNSLNDRINTYGARYTYNKGKLKGSALISNSITDQSLANIDVSAGYKVNDAIEATFRYQNMNKLPNLNFNLYQSNYIEYNWFNDFKNEKINNIEIGAKTKWVDASVQFTVLNDHLYFRNTYVQNAIQEQDIDTLIVKPFQAATTINYFSVKLAKEFKWWKLGLDNTLLYQQVDQQENILNVPQLVTRNTLYFSDSFFKKALYLQTGFTFQYFTSYYGNDYNPLIGEFYVQDKRKFGDFPLIDFFINAKIRQFRVFLKAEHFNSSFTGYDFYSAPNYPYRDFTIRFGVIWDFFT